MTRRAHVFITKRMRTTVTCEVSGHVKSVTFFVNGYQSRTDYSAPYSIAGDFYERRKRRHRFAPWKYGIDNAVVTLSCQAIGFDGTKHFANLELSSAF